MIVELLCHMEYFHIHRLHVDHDERSNNPQTSFAHSIHDDIPEEWTRDIAKRQHSEEHCSVAVGYISMIDQAQTRPKPMAIHAYVLHAVVSNPTTDIRVFAYGSHVVDSNRFPKYDEDPIDPGVAVILGLNYLRDSPKYWQLHDQPCCCWNSVQGRLPSRSNCHLKTAALSDEELVPEKIRRASCYQCRSKSS